MKRTSLTLILVSLAFISFQTLAFAQTVTGKVEHTDELTGKIMITESGCKNVDKCGVLVTADQYTEYIDGIKMKDLKKGKIVTIEIYQDELTAKKMAGTIELHEDFGEKKEMVP